VDVSKANHIMTTLKLRVPATGLVVRLVRYAVIAGTVRDTEGRPLPGRISIPTGRTSGSTRIAVLVKQPGTEELKAVRQVALEEGGRYRIFDLPPGQYAVGLWWAGLPVGSGASFSVSGKIEGPTPKTNYSVTLGISDLPALPVAQLWTEEDGSFRLEKIPPGAYDLFAAGPVRGYGAFEALLDKNPVYGRTRIQVIGQNLDGVSVPVSAGRTVDVVLRGPPDGCPKTTEVTLTLLDPWGLLGGSSVQANFDKPQTARDLAPGRYSLSAARLDAGCYQVNRPVVDLSRDAAGPVTLQLAQSGSIRGTLRAGTATARDYAVMLLDAEAAGSTAQLAFTDEQGHFEFAGLRPGRYRIAAQPAAGPAKARWVADFAHMMEIDVPGGVPTELELPVSKGGAQ
jgi:hypothetical protein